MDGTTPGIVGDMVILTMDGDTVIHTMVGIIIHRMHGVMVDTIHLIGLEITTIHGIQLTVRITVMEEEQPELKILAKLRAEEVQRQQ